MTQIIILCAGTAQRWQNYLGLPKQLAPVMGQPLLLRTIKQLHDRDLKDIYIVSHDRQLHLSGTHLVTPENCQWTVASLNSTQFLWKGNQIILLGDVCYTPKALKTIIEAPEALMFFGCPGANRYTGSQYAELFALRFTQSALNRIQNALSITLSDAADGGRGKLWELYSVLCGKSLVDIRNTRHLGVIEGPLFTSICDLTDDIDTPEDYHRLCYVLSLYSNHICA